MASTLPADRAAGSNAWVGRSEPFGEETRLGKRLFIFQLVPIHA